MRSAARRASQGVCRRQRRAGPCVGAWLRYPLMSTVASYGATGPPPRSADGKRDPGGLVRQQSSGAANPQQPCGRPTAEDCSQAVSRRAAGPAPAPPPSHRGCLKCSLSASAPQGASPRFHWGSTPYPVAPTYAARAVAAPAAAIGRSAWPGKVHSIATWYCRRRNGVASREQRLAPKAAPLQPPLVLGHQPVDAPRQDRLQCRWHLRSVERLHYSVRATLAERDSGLDQRAGAPLHEKGIAFRGLDQDTSERL
jgi:hypothetical protein